jgi:hypothetical protein
MQIPHRALRLMTLAAVFSFPTLLPVTALADTPGQHPHYLHALSDLRHARALLHRPEEANVATTDNVAVREIDRAIAEIKRAAIDDGKDVDDHTPIDTKLAPRDRFQEALELLHKANQDLNYEEDDKKALGWRRLARAHDSKAISYVRWAIRTDHFDDTHHP